MTIRKRVYEILEVRKTGDLISRGCDIFIIFLISLNIAALILESVASINGKYSSDFRYLEYFSIIVFSIEYILRLWSSVEREENKKPVIGRIKYVIHPLSVIDLLAILPFYLPFIGLDLRFFRIVRMMRIFRVAKLGRYSHSFQIVHKVVRGKREQLVSSLFILIMVLIFASTIMYFAENEQQPERFSSIPASMWWAVSTLTTVGYGDIYPVTGMGKFMGSVIAIIGIGMFAIPTGIIGAGFVEHSIASKQEKICPHCGRKIEG